MSLFSVSRSGRNSTEGLRGTLSLLLLLESGKKPWVAWCIVCTFRHSFDILLVQAVVGKAQVWASSASVSRCESFFCFCF